MSTPAQSDTSIHGVAFLGPLGTYSHQAATDRFGCRFNYHEQQTIAGVFHAVSPGICALIPQENSIYGPVIETYDLLRMPNIGATRFVVGEVTLDVRHCLVATDGVQLKDIKYILSHEQALGQCSQFIQKCLPHATLVKMPSTAAAAEALSTGGTVHDPSQCAAICSAVCTTVFPEMRVLREGIQNHDDNRTRFYILGESLDVNLPQSEHQPPHNPRRRALCTLRLPTCKDKGDTETHRSDITAMLAGLELPVIRLDRRPSLEPMPFENIYFIEVEDRRESCDLDVWIEDVQHALERARNARAETRLIGAW